MPNNPFIKPFKFYVQENKYIYRIPYQYEDDMWFYENVNSSEDILFKDAFYQIFNFHPIHIFLNSNSMRNYESLKKELNKSLTNVSELECLKYINEDKGTLDHLLYLLNNIPRERFIFASEVCNLKINERKQIIYD